MPSSLITFLRQHKPIPDADAAVIDAYFQPKAFKEGDYLFKGGKICNELFFVCSGILGLFVINDKGVDITGFFVKENVFCSILHSFNNRHPADESIRAATDTEVLAITHAKLMELYRELPYMKELIDRITYQRLLDKIQARNAYLGQDSATRYKLFLLQEPDIASRVPIKDIASFLEITPQSLSRIRKQRK